MRACWPADDLVAVTGPSALQASPQSLQSCLQNLHMTFALIVVPMPHLRTVHEPCRSFVKMGHLCGCSGAHDHELTCTKLAPVLQRSTLADS